MTRGDLVTVAMSGDFGKPRLALVIQSDHFADIGTLTLLFLTSTLVDAPLIRVTIDASPRNGLNTRSQVMVDKAMTVRREKIGSTIGQVEPEQLLTITRALAAFLRIA